jgi:SagB-type dehydrogenase family enzyme
MDPTQIVLDYHERTRHHPHRFARSAGQMEWAIQPDPFRRFEGAPRVELPLLDAVVDDAPFEAIYEPAGRPPAPLDAASLSDLLLHSLALSAWKQLQQSRWSLRCNPSSGNLHPTEAYAVLPATGGICAQPSVLHYAPFDHALELRAVLEPSTRDALFEGAAPGAFGIALTSIHWRESWKYGERAFRYCQLDVGHAIAAVAFAASLLGWRTHRVDGVHDEALARLLGIDTQDGPEAEHPDVLLWLAPHDRLSPRPALAVGTMTALLHDPSPPNQLSPDHRDWPIIAEVAAASRRVGGRPTPSWPPIDSAVLKPTGAGPARTLLRRRRSAQEMDGETVMPLAGFASAMTRMLATGAPLQSMLDWAPAVHPFVFVHRVEGLESGLYALPRTPQAADRLRFATRPGFAWERPTQLPEQLPEQLPLWLLARGDLRAGAAQLSCGQGIASEGCFAVAFVAEFAERLATRGPWFYRALHWEAGALGQVLYVEAEAAGLRGTGIGCFFDDACHDVLGLQGDEFQTLYHFTVGGPLQDPRLETLDPYHHLAGRR